MTTTTETEGERPLLSEETRYGWYSAHRDGEEFASGVPPIPDEVLAQAHEIHWAASEPQPVILPPEGEIVE